MQLKNQIRLRERGSPVSPIIQQIIYTAFYKLKNKFMIIPNIEMFFENF